MVGRHASQTVFERDGWKCHYCTVQLFARIASPHPHRATIDHMHPISKGGTDDINNLVACCNFCNGDKGDIPYDMYLWYREMIAQGFDRLELIYAIAQVEPEYYDHAIPLQAITEIKEPSGPAPWVGTAETLADVTYTPGPLRADRFTKRDLRKSKLSGHICHCCNQVFHSQRAAEMHREGHVIPPLYEGKTINSVWSRQI